MPMVSNQRKKILLATLIPFLLQPQPFPLSTTDTAHILAAGTATAAALAHKKAQPEQGGERITDKYLESISEAECIWRFR